MGLINLETAIISTHCLTARLLTAAGICGSVILMAQLLTSTQGIFISFPHGMKILIQTFKQGIRKAGNLKPGLFYIDISLRQKSIPCSYHSSASRAVITTWNAILHRG